MKQMSSKTLELMLGHAKADAEISEFWTRMNLSRGQRISDCVKRNIVKPIRGHLDKDCIY